MPEETAVLETPPSAVAEAKPEEVKMPEGGFTFKGNIADLLADPTKLETPKTPPVEEKKTEEVKPPETPKEKGKVPNIEADTAAMRKLIGEEKARNEALAKELEELRKSHEEYKTKVPETAAEEAKTWREKHEAALKEREILERDLQSASYERSAKFKREYVIPIQETMKQMVALAKANGVDEAAATAAVNAWDQTKFGEWVEAMSPLQQSQFGAAMHSAIQLDQAAARAKQEGAERWKNDQIEEQQKQQQQVDSMKRNWGEQAKTVFKEFSESEFVKANPDLAPVIKMGVERVANQQFTPHEIMQQIGANPILHAMVKSRDAALEETQTKLAELEKKIAEQDEFIKKQTGSTPVPGSGSQAANLPDEPFIPWQAKVA